MKYHILQIRASVTKSSHQTGMDLFKGIVMQIEKALINDRLRVTKVSLKFPIPTIYKFEVICAWNVLCSKKVAFFLTVSIVFPVYDKTLRLNNLKIRATMNSKISVFVVCVEAIIYLSLCNLHDCTFKFINLSSGTIYEICSKLLTSFWCPYC